MYKLQKLQYLYQDLEPYIDTHTMGVHYNKHAKNYLNKLNNLLTKNNYNFNYSLEELTFHINEFPNEDKEDILFNLGGVLNHNLYFSSINPNHNMPFGNLKTAINNKYKSYDNFSQKLKEKALSLKGSGYTFLVINNNYLDIVNTKNQETPLQYGLIPLLNIDMWEHAYYLNYKNEKEEYLNNLFNILDFTNASNIYNNLIK